MKPGRSALVLCVSLACGVRVWATALPDSCGDDKVKFDVKTEAGQPLPAGPVEGKAEIVFIENQMITPFHYEPVRFGMDGAWAGASKGDSYFVLTVASGVHHLCASWQSDLEQLKKNVKLTSFTAEAALGAPYNGVEIQLQVSAPQAREPASPSRSQSVDTTRQNETKTVQAPAPTLKVATQLVQVSVVVQDKHGKPITGLKKSDFTVLDNKQRQEIQFFSGEENSAEGQARSQPPLPPNTFTNKVLSTSAGLNNVTVILLDALNTPLLDQSYARDQVIKFLQQIKPEDHIAIYTLGRHLRMMHDFTTDSASLVEIMQKYKGRPTTELEASKEWNDSPLQTFLLPREAEASADTAFGDRVRITAEAFQDIANHLAWAPGRKNLIWVSGAFPLVIGLEPRRLDAPVSYTDEIEQVTKVLNNANLVVYPVDARGIVGGDLTGAGTGMRFEGPAGHGDWPSLLTMSAIASLTGGKAYFNNDDIKGCIQEAMNDASVTYKLAYAPQGITWNGRYRRIKVEVGVPGAKVRAREGYFATPLPNANERGRSAILGGTAMSPLEATAIELTTRVMATDVSTRKIAVVTWMDLHQIFFKSEGGKRIAKIDAALAQVDDRNTIVGVESQAMSLELAPEVYQRLLAQGGTYSKEVTVDPKAVSLRIVIRDADTGNIGSVNVPLEKYFPKAVSAN